MLSGFNSATLTAYSIKGYIMATKAKTKAGRVADFLELGELLVDDAAMRTESCGGHFRLESQTEEGEALRDDEHFAFVAAWEYKGDNQPEVLNKEILDFEFVHLTQRSYK